MLRTLLIIGILFTTSNTLATESLNKTMVEIGHTMEQLFPLIFDKQDPDKKNQQMLKQSVEKLITLFDTAKPHINAKSPTYGISFAVIKTQLAHAKSAIKYDNFKYTKSILRDVTTVCSSCHTQDTKTRTLFPNVKRATFDSDREYAEFNYITRQYDTAVEYYNKHLNKVTAIEEAELLSIMKQIITIYIQIDYQPDQAANALSKLKNYKHHTRFTRKTLDEWLEGIRELTRNPERKQPVKDFKKLKFEVHKILGDLHEAGSAQFPNKRERISRLWLRGSLYHYLNTSPPKDEVPLILYWLAIVDQSINFSIYYSLSDMYLKECVLKYTSSPYAQKCFDEYKETIILSYSGSRGTDIPEDIQLELEELQQRINGVPK